MQKCKELMTKELYTCSGKSPVYKAAKIMADENVGTVPIVASENSREIIGFVTDRDLAIRVIAEKLDAEKTSVSSVMTERMVVCQEDDEIETALRLMKMHKVRRLPVVDSQGDLVGLISDADIACRLDEPEKISELISTVSEPDVLDQALEGKSPQ